MKLIEEGQAAEEVIQTTGGTSLAARNVSREASSAQSSVAANIRQLIFDLAEGGFQCFFFIGVHLMLPMQRVVIWLYSKTTVYMLSVSIGNCKPIFQP